MSSRPAPDHDEGYVDVRMYAELNDFVAPEWRGGDMRRPFRPHQTVKDVIEAAGVPHTEVDLILVKGEPVGFSHRPVAGDRIAVYPVFETLDIGPVNRLEQVVERIRAATDPPSRRPSNRL